MFHNITDFFLYFWSNKYILDEHKVKNKVNYLLGL